MTLCLLIMFVVIVITPVAKSSDTAGLDPRVWKGFLEETNVKLEGQDKSLTLIFVIFLWPEFTKWMPINVLLPGTEVVAVDETTGKESYVCSKEGRMSTSIEIVQVHPQATGEKAKVTITGRLNLMYLTFDLFGEDYQFDENERVTGKVWFAGLAWFRLESELRDVSKEVNPSPECLYTVHDISVNTLTQFADKSVGWTPGVKQTDAEKIFKKFTANTSIEKFQAITTAALVQAMKRKTEEGQFKWVCLSENFNTRVKSYESIWKYSEDYHRHCSLDDALPVSVQ